MKGFTKFLFSTPGVVMLGVMLTAISLILGTLFGSFFYFIATFIIGFLILLIVYLVLYLLEESILHRARQKCLNQNIDNQPKGGEPEC